jgi:hypothetical protein
MSVSMRWAIYVVLAAAVLAIALVVLRRLSMRRAHQRAIAREVDRIQREMRAREALESGAGRVDG